MPSPLQVFFNDSPVGRLSLEQDRTYVFQYDPSWLHNPMAIPLSVSLPLGPEKHLGDVVRFFFANILPEGGLRDRLARQLGISSQNVISTQAYDELSAKLAMKIGGENRQEWIMKRHWERMAKDMGSKPKTLLQDLKAFCHTLEAAIPPTMQALATHEQDAAFLKRLADNISRRIATTLRVVCS